MDTFQETLAKGLHLSSPAAMASILTQGEYARPRHIDYINDVLVNTLYGGIRRLIVTAPPRHGKSQLLSVWYPTWRLAWRPTDTIGIICHTHALARDWGMKIQQNLKQFAPEIGIELSEDSQAAHRWRTKDGGGVVCFGIDGSPIGMGFNCLIEDDPFPNAEIAESEISSNTVWKQYQWVSSSRLEPNPTVIVTHQRWNDRDLIGRLLAAQAKGPGAEGYDSWTVINLPALAEGKDPLGRQPGAALWPERYDEDALNERRIGVGEYAFSAMFQQRCVPQGGGIFKERLWNYWTPKDSNTAWQDMRIDGRLCTTMELPAEFDAIIQSWDMNYLSTVKAFEHGRETDPVAGHVWGRKGADYFLLDRVYGRFGLDETIHQVRMLSAKHPQAYTKLVENTANGPAVMAKLRHEVGGFRPISPRGSKMSRVRAMHDARGDDEKGARALTLEGVLQAGHLWLPHPQSQQTPWVEEYRKLMGQFPKAGRDDTDATSQAFTFLAKNEHSEFRRAWAEAQNTPGPMTVQDQFKARIQKATEAAIRRGMPKDPNSLYYR